MAGFRILFFQKIKVSALSHSSPKKKHPTHCFKSTCINSIIINALYAKTAVIADHWPQRHRESVIFGGVEDIDLIRITATDDIENEIT